MPIRKPSNPFLPCAIHVTRQIRRLNRLHNHRSIVSEIDNLFGGANSAGCVEQLAKRLLFK